MHTSLTLQRARLPEIRWLLAAFLLVFAFGSASGFVVRALTSPTAASNQRVAAVRVTEPCPSGSHVVVWYSAETWGCVSDARAVERK
jgi:hypothetical protein